MDRPQAQVLLHEAPAVALIEERYGGTEAVGGSVHYHLCLQQVSRLKTANCKNLQGQMFDIT